MMKFVRQEEIKRNLVTFVVPQRSHPPYAAGYHYLPFDDIHDYLEDDTEISDGIFTFKVKDGVLGTFEMVAMMHKEFSWSFASSKVVDVLAAVRIGETIEVKFDQPFNEIYGISRYHFPSGIPDSGYGQYRIHLCEDSVTPNGFIIVSSFEGEQTPTLSRLPFFFGFRVFGSDKEGLKESVWRSFIALSIRYFQENRWHLSILHTAFALESFIDTLLRNQLSDQKISEGYIEYILRISDKREKLQAINEMILNNCFASNKINKLYEELNKSVFTKRNKIAHGHSPTTVIDKEDAIQAILTTVSLIWDFDRQSRQDLLITSGPVTFESLIDKQLLDDCLGELVNNYR